MTQKRLSIIRLKEILPCLVAMIVIALSGWVQNASTYAETALYFGLAREINTFANAFAFLALAIVAQWLPSLLEKRSMALIALGCQITSTFILVLAMPMHHAAFTVVGLAFGVFSSAWAMALLALSLTALSSRKAATAVVAFGYAISELARSFLSIPPVVEGLVISAFCTLCGLVLLYRLGGKVLDRITTGSAAAELELSNPESFLSPSHTLFIGALLFSFASGYALTLNEVENAPPQIGLIGAVLLVVAVWLVFGASDRKEDSLFSFATLLVIAGFLIAPYTVVTGFHSANSLIRIGIIVFDILLWLVIVAVGKRNLFALLPTLGVARFMKYLGTNAGAITGHTSNDVAGTNEQVAALIATVAVFIFVACLWLWFRKFSFSDTIEGITEAKEPQPVPVEDNIEQRCSLLGERFGLTERETEIFAMLARGRNGQVIREHYVVSRNTVKSHIKHIYQKLGVHSQQELIDLVEKSGGISREEGEGQE